jgi:S-layer homology domain
LAKNSLGFPSPLEARVRVTISRKKEEKMRTRVFFATLCFVASSILVAATPDTGRYTGTPRPGAVAQPVQPGLMNSPNDFGAAGDTVSTFIPQAFRPVASFITFNSFLGAMWPTNPPVVLANSPEGVSGPVFTANLQVPEGAIIDYVALDVCNDNGTAAPLLFGVGEGISDFVAVSTTVTNGCALTTSNLIGHQVGANAGTAFYFFINWEGGPMDASVRWRHGEVWWHRSVSPAPGSPTFADVPLSDPGFQFIEALVASGITAGCGGGNYCPDATLTRRQMAVFLAKALGLYWPNTN